VSRLRQKLGDDPKAPQLIKTVRGEGYLFDARDIG
jgi:two-component system OmpR family response regulator